MTQLNTPYPATAYLTGFLRARGFAVAQADASIAWVLRLLSREGLARILAALPKDRSAQVEHVRENHARVLAVTAPVVAFLQGRDPSLATRIASRKFLPEGARFASIGPADHEDEYLDWAFGALGTAERAKYFASLFIEDLADAIRDGVDEHFAFSRYGEQLATSAATIDALLDALAQTPVTAAILDELTRDLLKQHQPEVVGLSVPFPGNVLGALRMSRICKQAGAKVVWGGGYINTELRAVNEPRLFDFIDALTYDDGERPFMQLLEHWQGAPAKLLRTRTRQGYATDATLQDVPFAESACPTYQGLPLQDYLSIVDALNPMHRLWSEQRWNKLTVAHGCYWKKCTFCDVSLDYISRYEPLAAKVLVDRMETLIAETGSRGFHFVDEAAPPAVLKALAEEILKRGVQVSWWGNIRFEKTFTPGLCKRLAQSGCIAVSGGLEVASNRLLSLMKKGVTVEQVARVTKAFAEAGVMVHAYLMYGFPTQTERETIDSLEMVRQMFAAGCLDSAYWHRFSATAHAPVGQAPQDFGITLERVPFTFAQNDLQFSDATGVDHARLGEGLRKAVYNFMHGMGLEDDVRRWFDHPVPKAQVAKKFIREALG